MRRGTTPTLTFTTPYDADQVQDGYITITQGGLRIEHALADADVTVADNEIQLVLSQAETLSLDKGNAKVQIRATLTGGKKVASDIIVFKVGEILKDGEI